MTAPELMALYPGHNYSQPFPESGNWYMQDEDNAALRILVGSEIWWEIVRR